LWSLVPNCKAFPLVGPIGIHDDTDNRSSTPDTLLGSGHTVSDNGTRKRFGPIQLNRMEVSVRTDYEQSPTSPMTRPGSFVTKEAQGNFKVHEASLDINAESGQEK